MRWWRDAVSWRITLHFNGLSLARCMERREYFRRELEKMQFRDTAFAKPYLKGFFA